MTTHDLLIPVSDRIMNRLKGPRQSIRMTPGELFDRLTINWVKRDKVIDPVKLAKVCSDTVELEEAIYGDYRSSDGINPHLPGVESSVDGLYKTHTRLWVVEDDIRDLDARVFPAEKVNLYADPNAGGKLRLKDEAIDYMRLARLVYTLNDQRSKYKEKIDEACGYETEVKQYKEFDSDKC